VKRGVLKTIAADRHRKRNPYTNVKKKNNWKEDFSRRVGGRSRSLTVTAGTAAEQSKFQNFVNEYVHNRSKKISEEKSATIGRMQSANEARWV
jgi:hypothetical protein